jgi:hypothetical protein
LANGTTPPTHAEHIDVLPAVPLRSFGKVKLSSTKFPSLGNGVCGGRGVCVALSVLVGFVFAVVVKLCALDVVDAECVVVVFVVVVVVVVVSVFGVLPPHDTMKRLTSPQHHNNNIIVEQIVSVLFVFFFFLSFLLLILFQTHTMSSLATDEKLSVADANALAVSPHLPHVLRVSLLSCFSVLLCFQQRFRSRMSPKRRHSGLAAARRSMPVSGRLLCARVANRVESNRHVAKALQGAALGQDRAD